VSRSVTIEQGDTTIQQLADSAIRKCARGELAPQEVVDIFKYGEGVVQGKRYRGLVKMALSVEILQPAIP